MRGPAASPAAGPRFRFGNRAWAPRTSLDNTAPSSPLEVEIVGILIAAANREDTGDDGKTHHRMKAAAELRRKKDIR